MKANLPRGLTEISIAVLVAAAVGFAVLSPAILTGSAPAFGDNVSFWAPSTAYWTQRAAEGELALWNPYILGGMPFAADINHGHFYPPNWLCLVMGAARAVVVLSALHIALAAFGMYLFLKSRGVRLDAAVWGGVIFALSASYLSLVNHLVMLESISYLPLVLFAASRLAARPSLGASLVCGLFLALSALAGDVHATYMAALAAAALVASECTGKLISGRGGEAGRTALFFALAGCAALLLAAAGVMPAVELARETARAEGAASYAASHGLDGPAALGIFAPLPWGSLRDGTCWNFRWSNAVFVGLPLVLLGVYGARRLAERFAGVLLVVLCAALSFGALSPVWRLAYRLLPGFRNFRQPREYFIIALAGLVLLGAHGMSDLADGADPPKKAKPRRGRKRAVSLLILVPSALVAVAAGAYRLLDAPGAAALVERLSIEAPPGVALTVMAAAASTALCSIGLAGVAVSLLRVRWRVPLGAVLLATVIVGEFALASSGYLSFGPADLYRGAPSAAGPLREALYSSGAPRFAPVGPGFGEYFEDYVSRNTGTRAPGAGIAGARSVKECLVDNEPVYAGLPSALGYSTFLPRRYAALYSIAAGEEAGSPVRLRARAGTDWALLGVGALLRFDGVWERREVAATASRPAIHMAYSWRRAESFGEAARMLKAARDSAVRATVVEGLPEDAPAPERAAAHSIDDVRRTPETLEMLVHTDEPGLLVVMENNYPGWRAFDNGIETKIYTADLAFRAVYLTHGRHRVRFEFTPTSVYVGIAVSLASLGALIAAGVAAGVAAWRK